MDCFGCFFQADELKGDNMYRCEKCKMLRNGLKYSQVNNKCNQYPKIKQILSRSTFISINITLFS